MKLAFDKQTVRTIDQDGRLHVSLTNISKANVSPYLGEEIPDGEALGLDPKKVYQLLRDPNELEKAAPTFNNLQLLYTHKPVHVTDPQKEITVGSSGTDAVFEYPYLKNSLVIWDAEAIESVEDDTQREISCAYHYIAVMTPGTFEGTRYDGIMTEIRGNHIALVTEGRAGSDVVVGDSLPEELQNMKVLSKKAVLVKGALMAILPAPKLATDAKLDFDKILSGVTTANWKSKKKGIVTAIKPQLAQDADINDVVQLLDSLDNEAPAEETPVPALDAESPNGEILAMLKGKISDEDYAAIEAKLGTGAPAAIPAADDLDGDGDEEALLMKLKGLLDQLAPAQEAQDEFPSKDDDEDKEDEKEMKEPGVTKQAMDSAIATAVKNTEKATIARLRGVAAAEEIAKEYVGKLAVAMDSAEGVYKAALEILNIEVSDVHPSAYKHILMAQPKTGSKPRIAQDQSVSSDVSALFPDLQRLN